MFQIHDTSRSLTVARENNGYAIQSELDGNVSHASGFTFDEARSHVDALNRLATILPVTPPATLFALYGRSHLTVGQMGDDVISQLECAAHTIANQLERVGDFRKDMPFVNDLRNALSAFNGGEPEKLARRQS